MSRRAKTLPSAKLAEVVGRVRAGESLDAIIVTMQLGVTRVRLSHLVSEYAGESVRDIRVASGQGRMDAVIPKHDGIPKEQRKRRRCLQCDRVFVSVHDARRCTPCKTNRQVGDGWMPDGWAEHLG